MRSLKKSIECIFLKPKCYSFKVQDNSEKRRAKGISRRGVLRMSHGEYKLVYKMQSAVTKKIRRITSQKHQLYTIEQEKWALSALDNKRAWIDMNSSVPYGHYTLTRKLGNSSQTPPEPMEY